MWDVFKCLPLPSFHFSMFLCFLIRFSNMPLLVSKELEQLDVGCVQVLAIAFLSVLHKFSKDTWQTVSPLMLE